MNASPVRPGDVLASKYRVERVLGVGGMGVVVLATHTQLDQAVALKFLLPEATANAQVASRFMREARLAVKLKSEHVAKVLDVGTLETGAPYIVMEYLRGEDLAQRIQRSGPLSLSDTADFVIQACDAVAEAHALGIVHRDLKPANLFLTQRADGTPLVKVLDFGISKASPLDEGGHGLTKTSAVMGSPHYMSPEQMISSKDVDARSDVWSVGAILHQLLTGKVPFDAETLGALMARVLVEPPPTLSDRRPDVPAAVSDLVMWCLQRDLAKRAPSVADVAMNLAPFAPPRTQPIAERIAAMLGRGGLAATIPPGRSSLPPSAAPQGRAAQALSSSVPPQGAMATSQVTDVARSQAAERRRGQVAFALVTGVVVAGAVAFGARHVVSSGHAPASVPRPATAGPAVDSAAAPAPTVQAAETAAPSGTAPVGSVEAPASSVDASPTTSASADASKKRGAPPRPPAMASPPPHAVAPLPPPPIGPRKSVLDDRN